MFKSFFQAGFECTVGRNRHRDWIDQIDATQHDRFIESDYDRLRSIGIQTIREGLPWPRIDRNGHTDFSYVNRVVRAVHTHDMEIIFDLFHFGYPEHLDIFSNTFPDYFAEYSYHIARFISENMDGPYYFTPVNEPSYLAWAAGDQALFAPYATNRGAELKLILIRAAIASINAIRSVIPAARIVNADPICHTVSASESDNDRVQEFNHSIVFESFDMLAGRLHPELGGSPEHLDIPGINYYWKNQWEWQGPVLSDKDPRRCSLGTLAEEVYNRYRRPIMISETAHCDAGRAGWIDMIAEESIKLLEREIPLVGVCIYPVLGMPEWHEPDRWTRMGLWDLESNSEGTLVRTPFEPALSALAAAQNRIGELLVPDYSSESLLAF